MDFFTYLSLSNVCTKLSIVIDQFTKMPNSIPIKENAKTDAHLARRFAKEIWRLHELPRNIMSDHDSRFKSSTRKELLKVIGIRPRMSTSYHCDPCHISIYSPGDRREIMNTHSESRKEEFHVLELPQSGKIQPRIIDPIYPPVTQSRFRLDSSYLGSKRISLSSGLPRAALSIHGDGATPKYSNGKG